MTSGVGKNGGIFLAQFLSVNKVWIPTKNCFIDFLSSVNLEYGLRPYSWFKGYWKVERFLVGQSWLGCQSECPIVYPIGYGKAGLYLVLAGRILLSGWIIGQCSFPYHGYPKASRSWRQQDFHARGWYTFFSIGIHMCLLNPFFNIVKELSSFVRYHSSGNLRFLWNF